MEETIAPMPPMPQAPPYMLYDPPAVTLATFLGSPIGGSILLALNYRRLSRPSAAVISVIVGSLATVLLIALAFILPSRTPGALLWIPQIIGMAYLARYLQGPLVELHKNAGGAVASKWKAAGVGLLSLILVFGGIFAVVMLQGNGLGHHVIIGSKDQVYYRGGATEMDANALGEALKKDGYLTDRGVTVAVSKDANGTVVSFVVGDGVWDNPKYVNAFQAIAREVAPSVGGLPVTLRLLNSDSETKKELIVK